MPGTALGGPTLPRAQALEVFSTPVRPPEECKFLQAADAQYPRDTIPPASDAQKKINNLGRGDVLGHKMHTAIEYMYLEAIGKGVHFEKNLLFGCVFESVLLNSASPDLLHFPCAGAEPQAKQRLYCPFSKRPSPRCAVPGS